MPEPLARQAIMNAPITEPGMLPAPPLKLAPPMTTAAMICNSSPIATEGSPCVSRENCITPAKPKNAPAKA